MTTVGDMVDRLYRDILEPPHLQPHMGLLAADIDTAATSITFSAFSAPEDEEYLKLPTLIEIDSEIMRIESYDSATKIATLHTTPTRNKIGTSAAAHVTGTEVKIGPVFTRQSVFSAVAENMAQLYPKLYTVRTSVVAPVGHGVYPLDDYLAVEVLEALPESGYYGDVHGKIVDHHPITGGRSYVVNSHTPGYTNLWLKYRRRFGVPTLESEDIDDLGLEPAWIWVVLIGAAADLLIGADVPRVYTDYVGRILEAEAVPVGTQQSLAGRLRGYRDFLLESLGREMTSEYKLKVRMRDPFEPITGGLR